MFFRLILFAALAAGSLTVAAERASAGPAGALQFAATSVDEMPQEMRSAYIRGIQEELAAHGYAPGPADGLLGPRTVGAIRKYQRDAGLPVDGVAGKELLDHLKFAQPKVHARPDPAPDPLALEVQTRLRELGYYRGELDGLVGGRTREAIRAYRYDTGLPISGAIDGPLLESLRPRQAEEPAAVELPESAEQDQEN